MEINELKEWLRIDSVDDDITLNSLFSTSKILIKQATGVVLEDVQGNSEALELYKTIQKMIITDLYENRDGASKFNPILISLHTQLEAFKLKET